MRLTVTLLALLLTFPALAQAPSATLEKQLAKVRRDLQSDTLEVRRTAITALIHSDLSAKLRPEIQAALKDSDAEVRSTAATAIGNLGTLAVPAVPDLIAQLEKDPGKEARETAARALGRIGQAAPAERRALEPLRRASDKDTDPV